MQEQRPLTVGRVLRALRTPVTLLVLLAVLGLAAWWGYKQVMTPIPPTPPTPCVPQAVESGLLQSTQVTVRVLNGGGKRGLAGEVAGQLRTSGFIVSNVGNTDESIEQTVIVVQSKDNPEAKLVLEFFPKSVVREDPARVDHGVDVLLGTKFEGVNTKAPTSLKVAEATVCLPAKPTVAG